LVFKKYLSFNLYFFNLFGYLGYKFPSRHRESFQSYSNDNSYKTFVLGFGQLNYLRSLELYLIPPPIPNRNLDHVDSFSSIFSSKLCSLSIRANMTNGNCHDPWSDFLNNELGMMTKLTSLSLIFYHTPVNKLSIQEGSGFLT